MTFLQQLSSIATLRKKVRNVYRPSDPRTVFIQQARKQADAIKEGVTRGHWFRCEADGSYVVRLKNGAAALPLDGSNCEVYCTDADGAVAVLNLAITAAEAGELDSLLEATKGAPRTRKKKAG